MNGDFAIPDELRDLIRTTSESELTEIIMQALKQGLERPDDFASAFGAVPAPVMQTLKMLPKNDASLRPFAQAMATRMIQEVKGGTAGGTKEFENAFQKMVQSGMGNMMGAQLAPPATPAGLDLDKDIREFVEAGLSIDDVSVCEEKFQAAHKLLDIREPDGMAMVYVNCLLSKCLLDQEKHSEAEPLLKDCIRKGEKLANCDVYVANAYAGLAEVRAAQDKKDDADLLWGKAVSLADKACTDPIEHAEILENAAEFYIERKLNQKADPLFDRCFTLLQKAHGESDPAIAEFAMERAIALMEREKFPDAEKWCKRGLKIKEQIRDPEDFDLVRTRVLLADIYLSSKNFGDAEAILTEAVARLESTLDQENLRYPLELLVDLYQATGRETELEQIRQKLLTMPLVEESE